MTRPSAIGLALTAMLVAASTGCEKRSCTEEPPTLRVVLQASAGLMLETVNIILTLDGESRIRTFDVRGKLESGQTDFDVELGALEADTPYSVVGESDAPSGRVSGDASGVAGPDGCNEAVLVLSTGGNTDAGVDAGLDSGEPTDAGDAGVDDLGPSDIGLDVGADAGDSGTGLVDDAASLRAAIAAAYAQPGHEVILIQAGSIPLGGELVLDECLAGCANGPDGVTLRPAGGEVVFTGGGITVDSGNNQILDLTIRNRERGLRLRNPHGVNSGGNLVRGVLIENTNREPGEMVDIQSGANQFIANRIDNSSGDNAEAGLRVRSSGGNVIAMNVIYGEFGRALFLEELPSGGTPTRVDHNSIHMSEGRGRAVDLKSSDNVCIRSNIIWGTSTSTAFDVESSNLAATCPGGPTSGSNSVGNHVRECAGDCGGLCPGPLCDLNVDPGFSNPSLCLNPSPGNALIDASAELGYDMVDGNPADFLGAAPEVGAREAGATRSFGTRPTTCP